MADRKMIEVNVRFWANDIPREGERSPKRAWTSGVVRVEPNAAHGITSAKAQPFNSLFGLPAAIKRELMKHGIVLHPSRKMRKYVRDREP